MVIRALHTVLMKIFLVACFMVLMPSPAFGQVNGTLSGPGAFDQVSKERALEKGCLSCHEGIEDINAKMSAQNVTCANCHYGNPIATTKEEAHRGLIADPGDLRSLDRTCGQCHSATPRFPVKPVESRGQKGHGERVLKGIMATAAGEISGTRYILGVQHTPGAIYGVRGIKDEDGTVPAEQGALPELLPLPAASTSDADNLLRHSCLQCHVWSNGRAAPGYYRGSGCSACHVLYADDGLSKSADLSVSKTIAGHPVKHEITIAIPTSQCLRCHDSGPGRYIGPQFTGTVPLTASLAGCGPEQMMQYAGDAHFQKGLECIDCHDSRTLHGDGNIYSKAEEQVSVRCETCHGTIDQLATLTDVRGNRPHNVFRRGSERYLTTKISNLTRKIPQVAQVREAAALPPAMAIPAHWLDIAGRNRLECYACHAQTSTQCYGCHLKRDDRKPAHADWVEGDAVKQTELAGDWEGAASSLQWHNPAIGVTSRGTVAPFVPGGQVLFTRISPDGTVVALNKTISGAALPFSFNPVQPHSVSRQARGCESCHGNPEALGLGKGDAGLKSSAATGSGMQNLPFDRWVNEGGQSLQATAHAGARPFTAEEMERINRTNACVACHKRMATPELWKPVTDSFGRALTTQQHKNALVQLFQKGSSYALYFPLFLQEQ